MGLRGRDDCTRKRMLTVGFDGSSDGEERVRVGNSRAWDHRGVGDRVMARGEGAGLVEENRVDDAHALEREAVLDQDPCTCRHRGRERDHEWDGQPERVRARDHQHGDRALDRVVRGADGEPREEGDHRGGRCHVEQEGRGAISECLRARARRLRFRDEPLDARECGAVTHCGDLHANGGIGGNRARDDAVPGALRHRTRLTRDHRLVDFGLAFGDLTISRDARPRSDQHDVVDRERPERHRLDLTVGQHPIRFVGQELGQRRERAFGLADGLHLQPVTEQHDHDQERELPPEVEIEVADVEARRDARHERDRDGEADEQHHPRLASSDLGDRAGQERPAAVEEEDGAEDGRDPRRPGREVVAEQIAEHVAEPDDRDREQQAPPETSPEHRDVVAVTAVARDHRAPYARRGPRRRGSSGPRQL